MTPDARRCTLADVGVFKWLYRLPGRITGSFDSTAAATSVVAGRATNAMGAKVVMGEVDNATTSKTNGSSHADDADQPRDPAGH